MFKQLKALFGAGVPKDAGALGEKQAAEWLRERRGYSLVVRNWRDPHDRRREIDLVFRDGEILVFVEVKARMAGALVPGYYAVTARKKRAMREAIDAYLRQLRKPPASFRFDVVEITHGAAASAVEVLHFENIPLFTKHYRR